MVPHSRKLSRLLGVLTLAGFVGAIWASAVLAAPPGVTSGSKLVYSFNLIGHPGDYTGGCGNGHRIFVNRDAHHAHILLKDENDGWHVENCNVTGNNWGELHTDDVGVYDIYVRILGKPGGTLFICADTFEDHESGDHLCLLGTIDLTRGSGKSKFKVQPSSLFDASGEDIVWSIDTNQDYRIAQFRVYKRP